MNTKIITVPGFHGSDAHHWQTWLETQFPDSVRLQGVDWEAPKLYHWAEALEKQLDSSPERAILVAHSFGCLVAALVASWRPEKVAGVILVTPASPSRFSMQGLYAQTDKQVSIAGLIPDHALNTLGVLIGSENDPWMTLDKAHTLSRQFGLAFYNAGKAGHINSESGYGEWPLVADFVKALLDAVEPAPGDDIQHLGAWNRYRKRYTRHGMSPVEQHTKAPVAVHFI